MITQVILQRRSFFFWPKTDYYYNTQTGFKWDKRWWGFGINGISWTICKQSAPRSRQITTPTPHHISQFLQASVKCRLVLPFWYRLSQDVLKKRPLNGCSSSSSMHWQYTNTQKCTYTRKVYNYFKNNINDFKILAAHKCESIHKRIVVTHSR